MVDRADGEKTVICTNKRIILSLVFTTIRWLIFDRSLETSLYDSDESILWEEKAYIDRRFDSRPAYLSAKQLERIFIAL